MIKNYLKIAYRNLIKSKIFSLINILGLAIGIAACLLILQYVQFELSYDQFHKSADQIYRIVTNYHTGEVQETTLTPPPLGPLLQNSYPEVINATRLILPWSGQAASSTLSWKNPDNKDVKQSFRWGFFVDPSFLEIFSFPLISGDRQEALNGINKIILSERAARMLFGNEWDDKQVIGQTLEYINEFDRFSLVISGIIADTPVSAHFQYDFLASFATLSTGWAKDYAETWGGNGVYTYLQFSPTADISTFHAKISQSVAQHGSEEFQKNADFELQPLTDIYLNSHREEELKVNGNALYIYFFSIVAILILLIALINYINLTIAKATSRGDEIGLRKVMGAQRLQLMGQFLFESLLTNGVALALALTILQLAKTFSTQFTGKVLDYSEVGFWVPVLLLYGFSTLVAGLYPALLLSRSNLLQLLKGKWYSPRGKRLRQGMVVFQFGVSIILIIFTFAIMQQLHHMRSNDPGFNREGVMVVKGPENRTETWIEHDQQKSEFSQGDPFKDALLPYVGVQSISLSRTTPGEHNSIYPIKLGALYNHSTIDVLKTDSDYAEVYGLRLLAGQFNTDDGYVINEQAAQMLGYDDLTEAVGETFKDDRNRERKINGVIQDYHHHSLQYEPRPLIFSQDDFTYKLDSYYSIKVAANNLENTIEQIAKTYKQVFPHDTFEYYFIDSYFDAQYQEDIRFSKLFGVFSGLTILIACMGLFGLSLHTVVEKTKEIGIRKVLGASIQSITALLSREFIRLMLIASVLALPIAYFTLKAWLTDYATRISLHWWLFLLPLTTVFLLAIITVGFQTVKASLANPIHSLRYE